MHIRILRVQLGRIAARERGRHRRAIGSPHRAGLAAAFAHARRNIWKSRLRFSPERKEFGRFVAIERAIVRLTTASP